MYAPKLPLRLTCLVALAATILLAPRVAAAENWLQFHENRLLTGVTNNQSPGAAAPFALWSFTHPTPGVGFRSSPAVHDGRVFVGCDDGVLYCFDQFTGAILWTFPTAADIVSSPAVAGGNVHFGSFDGNAYCLNEITGLPVWITPLSGPVWGSPTIVGNDLFITAQAGGAPGGNAYILDRMTGLITFTRPYSGFGLAAVTSCTPSVDVARALWFAGSHSDNMVTNDPTIEALPLPAAPAVWQYYDPFGGFLNGSGAAVDPNIADPGAVVPYNGLVIFGQFGSNSAVIALDEATGAVVWTAVPFANSTSTPAIHNERVFVGADDAQVYCLDERTGLPLWVTPTGGQVWSAPAVANGLVFVGSQDHNLYCLDELTGALQWTFYTGPTSRIEASPALADGIAFIGDAGDTEDGGTFWAIATPETQRYKWYQPPVPVTDLPQNYFYGWNEYSLFNGPQIVADDWLCTGPDPITTVRWWGSYIGWHDPFAPPPLTPAAFHFAVWTDVPAGPIENFSHPGVVIWEHTCTNTSSTFAGWDYDPIRREFEPAYFYECALPPEAWFYQPQTDAILWLSIAAVYPDGTIVEYPWGWKSRPRTPDVNPLTPDDAVRIFDPTVPLPGGAYAQGAPIFWPTPEDSWDMAFELIATRETVGIIKWDQPPDPGAEPGTFFGWDELSHFGGPQLVADDWPCFEPIPVTDIIWWGSFYGWPDLGVLPPILPARFHLGIWSNVPPGMPEPWSHPGVLLWEYWADDYRVDPFGVDRSPRPGDPPDGCYLFNVRLPQWAWFYQEPGVDNIYWLSVSAVYDPPICPCNADLNNDSRVNAADLALLNACMGQPGTGFCRRADLNCDGLVNPNEIPIFQCQMSFGWANPVCCNSDVYPFGWKTRPNYFMDDAVRTFEPVAPAGMPWLVGEPIQFQSLSWDATFALLSHQVEEFVKFSQPPVPFTPDDWFNGWNEPSVYGADDVYPIVADDWVCLTDEPVSDIHWWGSFLGWTEAVLPPNTPAAYHVGIWTDVPAGPEPFSHPGTMIWEFVVRDFNVRFAGWDRDPRDPAAPLEACFRFDADLPQLKWFDQEPIGEPTIHWISIAAIYDDPPPAAFVFGWKTRPRVDSLAPDDAVRIFEPAAPRRYDAWLFGEPLFWPTPAESWDMAFALTTRERHPCVCGDLNFSGGPVDLIDFATFATCYGLEYPSPSCDDVALACSDLNRDGVVDLVDFSTFAVLFGTTPTQSPPNCLGPVANTPWVESTAFPVRR